VSGHSDRLIQRSGYLTEGFPDHYDAFRPSPPAALLDLLVRLGGGGRPALVVDLGAGTGLSSRPWASRADHVVAIEANPAMAEAARARGGGIEVVDSFSDATGLEDGAADIVTCSQSFHWMDAEPTIAEIARILRPGGVFAAYDYDVPPVLHWEVERAFLGYVDSRRAVWQARGEGPPRFPKEEHLARLEASGRFRWTREVLAHNVEDGSAERIVGLALSLGPVALLLDEGVPEVKAAMQELEETAVRVLGDRTVPMHVGYRARIGVR
jgi:SAM-dependent methyltransferase